MEVKVTYHRNGKLIFEKTIDRTVEQMNYEELKEEGKRRAAECAGCNQPKEDIDDESPAT